jgi:8-oxo-dGTP pyrophosphatase MutT (NUDIX family)
MSSRRAGHLASLFLQQDPDACRLPGDDVLPSRTHLSTTVEAYLARHPDERTALAALLAALEHPDNEPTSSAPLPGDLTCSALVLDRDNRVLHLHHPADSKALAPGGGLIEPDGDTLIDAALRALREEAGLLPHAVTQLPGLDGLPLDITVRGIDATHASGEPGRQRYDVCFAFRLVQDDPAVVAQTGEVTGSQWLPFGQIASPALREKLLSCGFEGARHAEPVNASALIYNDAGEYLLHLRDNLPQIWEPGAWSLLGGGREPGDVSLEATVRRELYEEAGLDLPGLEPFAVETATGTDGTPVSIQVFAGRWNGAPTELHLTEGVMLAWFPPQTMPRLRLSPSTLDLVHRHSTNRAAGQRGGDESAGTITAAPRRRPSLPHQSPTPVPPGTVLNVLGVHLYLERDGALLLGRRSPSSVFAPNLWHVLAGHVEEEAARTAMAREAREEAGIVIDEDDLELVHVVHMREGAQTPRVQFFYRPSRWTGEPQLLESDRCTEWKWWPLNGLPEDLVDYTRAAVQGIAEHRRDTELGWPA